MGYLEEFYIRLSGKDFPRFLELWEEYCTCDAVDVDELCQLLVSVKGSDFAKPFGKYVEAVLPLWTTIQDANQAYTVLKLLVDLQTTNSAQLAELALQAAHKRYGEQKELLERLRIVGLRNKEQYQGALSYLDLLMHGQKGAFVYHTGGWGVGEVMEHASLRQQLAIEFENVTGVKHVDFPNLWKTLVPITEDHFLAKRFGNPDALEQQARRDPVEVIKNLLRDLGPKTAAEIKDELCELVIPESDWNKWWQGARNKMKKDPEIEYAEGLKALFSLRKEVLSQKDSTAQTLAKSRTIKEQIAVCYAFLRDHVGKKRQGDAEALVKKTLDDALQSTHATAAERLQVLFCLASIPESVDTQVAQLVRDTATMEETLDQIHLVAHKRQLLVAIRAYRSDWIDLFVTLLHRVDQALLRDFIVKELRQDAVGKEKLEAAWTALMEHPLKEPELFLWYFEKLLEEDAEGMVIEPWAEAFLMLLRQIEGQLGQKERAKRMYNLLCAQRYARVRQLFDRGSLTFVKEFLLLASKCNSFKDQDLKIFRSLAEVAHSSLAEVKKKDLGVDASIFWVTQEGYTRMQERAQQIGTKEIIENAREIEAARALGDLRENSEYKYALERRSRLQGELKKISQELGHARILTPIDVQTDRIGIGTVINIQGPKGESLTYTILGSCEADPEKNILSLQSKLGQSMAGLGIGDRFSFKDEEYQIMAITSYFDGK